MLEHLQHNHEPILNDKLIKLNKNREKKGIFQEKYILTAGYLTDLRNNFIIFLKLYFAIKLKYLQLLIVEMVFC